ncbi:MAG: M28 family peptidase, partial [Acidobacteriota bacterium]
MRCSLMLIALVGGLGAADYRASSIQAEALKTTSAWDRLRPLTDRIGARLTGSQAKKRAEAWAKSEFEKDGITVRLEPVTVAVWVRGEESARMLAPSSQPVVILGLGGTVGTPPGGITAPVVVVASSEQLSALGEDGVSGKIILYDNPFVRTGDEGHDYREAVKYRARGASDAARLGAVAALVRSVATASLRTPHTGALRYAEDAPRIPAAAVTIEDAALIHRLVDAGHEVRLHLSLGAHTEPDTQESNVVAEIRGGERPDEVVVIGAHLDSWDVGEGAIDDGSGCAMVMETMRLIASGPPPRRTVRAVLYANEENGLRGGRAYRDAHEKELPHHVAALEADSGAGRAIGLSLKAGEGGLP